MLGSDGHDTSTAESAITSCAANRDRVGMRPIARRAMLLAAPKPVRQERPFASHGTKKEQIVIPPRPSGRLSAVGCRLSGAPKGGRPESRQPTADSRVGGWAWTAD